MFFKYIYGEWCIDRYIDGWILGVNEELIEKKNIYVFILYILDIF